jgi:hypothetical protein
MQMPPKERLFSNLPFLTFLIAVSLYLFFSEYTLHHFPLDDAWIHRVYSRSFAFGHGLSYNAGSQEAGSTSPLWSIVTSPAEWFAYLCSTSPVLGTKVIGVLFGALVLHLIIQIGILINLPRSVPIITAILFSVEPGFLFSVLSGMETVLVLLLWLLMVLLLLREKFLYSALVAGFLVPTRPEAILCVPFLLTAIFLRMWGQHRIGSFCIAVLLSIVPGAVWGSFCRFSNGHWLPNTFYAKATSFSFSGEKISLTLEILTQAGYLSLPGVGFMLFLLANYWLLTGKNKNNLYISLFFCFVPLLYAFCVVMSRHIDASGYYWTRWIDPGTLLITMTVCAALAYSIFLIPKIRERQKPSIIGSIILVAVFVLMSNKLYGSFRERRQRLSSDAKVIYKMNERVGEWLAHTTPASSIVGANDAGAIKYLSNRMIIDVLGLNNHERLFNFKTMGELIREMQWLVVFPILLENSAFKNEFEPVEIFQVAPEEYTLCHCPGQQQVMVYRKVVGN